MTEHATAGIEASKMDEICAACGGKGFTNPDGSYVNAFVGSDSDPTVPCKRCSSSVEASIPERDPNYRPNRESLSNKEIISTGVLCGGAVANIARELVTLRAENRELRTQLAAKWNKVGDPELEPEYDTDLLLWAPGWKRVYAGYWRHSCEWIGRQSGESNEPLPDTNPTLWMYFPKPPAL
jgi:hypothetical protein